MVDGARPRDNQTTSDVEHDCRGVVATARTPTIALAATRISVTVSDFRCSLCQSDGAINE